jgi:hypothetical protein
MRTSRSCIRPRRTFRVVAAAAGLLCALEVEVGAQQTAEPEADRVARSVFLGQAYPSGALYLEAFRVAPGALRHSPEWPDRVRFLPLDQLDPSLSRVPAEPLEARFLLVGDWVNPPAAEGMLVPSSPCVPPGYSPRDGARYLTTTGAEEEPGVVWQGAEYFATNEWFGCAVEPSVPVYRIGEPIEGAFRVVAFASSLPVSEPDRSVAGTPRPMTPAEETAVTERRNRRERDREACTLEPRDLDGARQIVSFRVEGTPYHGRISSYVAACTALAEVFLLDLLEDGEVVATYQVSRWRGNP